MSTDAERMIIVELQRIRAILEAIASLPQNITVEGSSGNYLFDTSLLERLVSAALPAAPEMIDPVTVQTTETPLYANDTQDIQMIQITNDSIAQPVWMGRKGVTVTTGIRVPPTQRVPYVVPPGVVIYAVCALATVAVRVERGFAIARIAASQ